MKRLMKNSYPSILFLCLLSIFISCSHLQYKPESFNLTIAHINDTHSHLESNRDAEIMRFDGVDTKVFLGGFPRLKTAIDKIRNESERFLLLHAGDAVQGTLYFTLFNGDADIKLLNILNIDAMTFGNHEFDKGPELTNKLVNNANFSFLSANIDFSLIPSINSKVKPYLIKKFGSERVAIIGVTTEHTPVISSPGSDIKFNKVAESVMKSINELAQIGINKIIVLSHIGYEEDIKLAQSVAGIDIIVGGHSHTLLGDSIAFSNLGMKTHGQYPTIVKCPEGSNVLIVQAWRWGGVLGRLKVEFDADGHIKSYSGTPVLILGETFVQNKKEIPKDSDIYKRILQIIDESLVAGIYKEDPATKKILEPYRKQLDRLMQTVIAQAKEDLITGLNSGLGPIISDGMAWKTGAQIALLNRGGVRRDIYAGDISVGTVMEVLPFGNTLYLMELSGAEIKKALEEGIDFQVVNNSLNPLLPYVSGITYSVNLSNVKGSRITEIKVKNPDDTYTNIDMEKIYKFATLSYIAAQGGDGYNFFKDYKGIKYDTGLIDSDVLIEYLKNLKTLYNLKEQRITVKSSQRASLSFEKIMRLEKQYQKFEYFKKAA